MSFTPPHLAAHGLPPLSAVPAAPSANTSIFGNLKRMLENSDGSKFLLVNIVRKRAAQLNNGAPPLTDLINPNKPVSTAFNESAAGMLPFER